MVYSRSDVLSYNASSLTEYSVKYCSPATSTAIIRVARAHYRLVWSALTFLTQLPKLENEQQPRQCVFRVVKVSGTIKKVEEEVIRRAKAVILRAKNADGTGTLDDFLPPTGKDGDSGDAKDVHSNTSTDDENEDLVMNSDEEG